MVPENKQRNPQAVKIFGGGAQKQKEKCCFSRGNLHRSRP